jgi:hypothetical protein
MPRSVRLSWLAVVGALALGGCGASATTTSLGGDPDPGRIGPQGRVAQFIVQCTVSHIAFDDPIVLPWQPGASHQHQFFGNALTNSDPGYERVLGADTSCDQRRDTASYWSPTLLGPDGSRIDAEKLTAYYRPGDGVDPAEVVAYPPGFMMVAGSSAADEPQGQDVIAWSCGSGAQREDTPPQCLPDTTLRLWITFPDCWDSSRLTSFGSGAHVRYSDGGCPETHPIALPQLQMAIDFPPVAPEGLALSSGSINSAHADFWNTWDQAKLEREVAGCLNRDLVCGVSG